MIPHYPSPRRSLARAALSALTQWRIAVVWILATLASTLIVGIPVDRFLSAGLDRSVHAIAWANAFDLAAFIDFFVDSRAAVPVLGSAALVALLATVLANPFLSGMIIASAKMNRPLGFAALLQGGLIEYGRMLRTLLWSLIPLGVAAGAGGALYKWVDERAENAILESSATLEMGLAGLGILILVTLAHVSVEAGRAQFAVDAGRRSAVLAWWRGVRVVVARPIAAIGSYALITAIGVLSVYLLYRLLWQVPHAALAGWLLAVCFTELMVLVLVWMKLARLLVLVEIARPRPAAGAPGERTLH